MTKKRIQGEKPRIRMTDKHIPAVRAIGTIDSRAKFFRKKLTESLTSPSLRNRIYGDFTIPSGAEAVGVKSRVRSVFNTPTIIQGGRYLPLPDANVFLMPTSE